MGGEGDGDIPTRGYLYEASEYHTLPDMPNRRIGAAAVVVCSDETWLYVIGGSCESAARATQTVDMFNMTRPQWTKGIAQLKRDTMYHAAVVHNGNIVITGGVGTAWSDTTNECQCLNVSTHTVTYMPSMNLKRARHACVVYRDEVIVLGGMQYHRVQPMPGVPVFETCQGVITRCERFLPDRRAWVPFPDHPVYLSGYLSADVACDKIFTICIELSTFSMFDGAAWCDLISIPTTGGIIVQLDGDIVFLHRRGGRMQILDPVLLVWSEGPFLPSIPNLSAVVSF